MTPRTIIPSLAHKALLGLAVAGLIVSGTVLGFSSFGPASPAATDTATVAGSSTAASSNGKGNGATPPAKNFTISGAVDGLAPGVTVQLVPVINNTNNQAILVNSLSATLQTSTCSDKISVGSWVGAPFTVGKNASTAKATPPVNTGYFPVTMDPSATNACANKTFTLAFTGSAGQG